MVRLIKWLLGLEVERGQFMTPGWVRSWDVPRTLAQRAALDRAVKAIRRVEGLRAQADRRRGQ